MKLGPNLLLKIVHLWHLWCRLWGVLTRNQKRIIGGLKRNDDDPSRPRPTSFEQAFGFLRAFPTRSTDILPKLHWCSPRASLMFSRVPHWPHHKSSWSSARFIHGFSASLRKFALRVGKLFIPTIIVRYPGSENLMGPFHASTPIHFKPLCSTSRLTCLIIRRRNPESELCLIDYADWDAQCFITTFGPPLTTFGPTLTTSGPTLTTSPYA